MPCGRSVRASSSARITTRRSAGRSGTRRQACVYVSPYAHPYVIAGAGTVALEILAQDPSIEVIVCPVGGGGLASGIAIAAGDRAATWGVETEASCPFTRASPPDASWRSTCKPSLADGLAGNLDPETITFDLVRQHVAGIATVAEAPGRERHRSAGCGRATDRGRRRRGRRGGRRRGPRASRRTANGGRAHGSEHRPRQAASAHLSQ